MSRNQQGVTAYKSGQWSEAEALFEQAMKQYPDDPTIKQDLRIAKAKVKSGGDRCGPSKLPNIPFTLRFASACIYEVTKSAALLPTNR
jgi:hypothetical protein